jgi:actin-related protein
MLTCLDGTIIEFARPRFQTPEALFQPNICGVESAGVHSIVWDSIKNCDIDLRKDLSLNIVLSGGTTCYKNFAERLTKEVTELVPNSMKVKVSDPAERKYTVWIGGSVLASLSTFTGLMVSKEEYEEIGPKVIHQKCY